MTDTAIVMPVFPSTYLVQVEWEGPLEDLSHILESTSKTGFIPVYEDAQCLVLARHNGGLQLGKGQDTYVASFYHIPPKLLPRVG